MKVYLKVHSRDDSVTIACCDEDLLNKCFKEGTLKIEISKQYYGGDLISLEDAVIVLKDSYNFNVVGRNIIDKIVDCKILPKEGIRLINGIPMAMKMVF